MRRPATQRMQKAEVPLPPQAATLDAQSPIANRQSQIPGWLMAALLVLVTIALYWPTTSHDFINYDDEDYITSNLLVQKGLTFEGMKWTLLNPVCCNWHPLTVWSHMLDCQLFGLKPWGHHLTSVLLHALNAALAFALLQLMTGATWRSLLVAALFALHPLRVESVAWASERKDVLSGCFGLLTLMAYARYAQGSGEKAESRKQRAEIGSQKPTTPNTQPATCSIFRTCAFYLLSLFFFALGVMSKPMLVTWPFVMLLLDYWPLKRMQKAEGRRQNSEARDTQHVSGLTQQSPFANRQSPILVTHQSAIANRQSQILFALLVEKIPFFAVAVAASVVTFLVQQRGGYVMAGEILPWGARLGNALVSYGRYLGKLVWPTDLAVYYPYLGQWPLGTMALAGGGLVGVSVLVFVWRRRFPYLLMGWLWFLGTLVPVIGLVQMSPSAMADRYTYLPSLGVLVLAVWGAHELTRGWRDQVLALWAACSVVIVLCLALTRQQLGHWKDGETLFRHALEVTENNRVAHDGLGVALRRKGKTDEAIQQLQESLRINPGCFDVYINLGVAFEQKGQIDEAIRQYQEALRLKPDCATAHNDLGVALGRKGQTDEAIRQLEEALRLNPDDALTHNNLGGAFYQQGRTAEAVHQYQEAIRLDPDYADPHNGLGIALEKEGQTAEAIRQLEAALRLNPDHTDAHYNLGVAFYQQGRTEEAIRQFQDAIRLKPNHAEAHNNLGTALGLKGQTEEAIRQFQEALRFQPDYADARRNLNIVLAAKARASQPPGASTNR
jgi:protein O-mannosyl-transferase